MTTRKDFRFFERLRVRWAEVDLQQIVFNGHYLMYFDTAVAGWWRALALPYQATMATLGGDFYVRKSTLEYLASARYDEIIDVGVRTERIGNSSKLLTCAVFRGDELLVQGELVYVFVNPATQTSQPVPQELRDVLQAFDSGQAMVDVRVGAWGALGREAAAIRHQVFVEEQKIPLELEMTPPTPLACMPWPPTAWACRWPPAGCWNMRPASRRSGAWRFWRRCAAAASAAPCWMR